MTKRALLLLLVLVVIVPNPSLQRSGAQKVRSGVVAKLQIPAPADVLGFTPGDDRKLASWAQVVAYFQQLDAASDRVEFAELGRTTLDAPFVMATISAPENLARLDEYRKIQEQLADPRKLGANPARKAARLIARGKTIVLITCGIHSTEVGSYLSSMLIAHRLASSSDVEIQNILKNTIILLVPSLNPDGVDIVKNWYDKTLGTPYEGTDPPELYHHYTGHDDNRDWYAFTQVETQITVDKIHNVWHPQIVHDIHQQGQFGSRLFLPPYMQPVEPNVPRQIVEGYTELGSFIAKEMRAQGFKGITTNSTYDAWSPSRAYSHYHGGVRILSETASCKIATPVTVKFAELVSREGYDPKKESKNFGPVWRGGEWHLHDITNHMTTAAFHLLDHAATNRERWLSRFYEIGTEAVRPRGRGKLQGFEISGEDKVSLRFTLTKAGVETDYFEPFRNRREKLRLYVPMAQPYGAFAKAVIEAQRYPNLRDEVGHPIAPYDVTAHSLSLLFGVEVRPVYRLLKYRKVDIDDPGKLRVFKASSKLAIYQSSVPSMDEGWTRWVIRQNGRAYPGDNMDDLNGSRPFFSLRDREARAGGLLSEYQVIVIPDQSARAILNGHRAGIMPPEYAGGIGTEGVKALREFVEQGGTLVCLNRASSFAIEQFKLPLRNVVAELPRTDFYVPGSILRLELDTSNPLAAGMPKESIAWVENSPVFEVVEEKNIHERSMPGVGRGVRVTENANQVSMSLEAAGEGSKPAELFAVSASAVHVVAWYPQNQNPLLSGWLLGGDRIKGKAALVEVMLGKGRIILFGFRPQYRGQSLATYPLLFNAIRGN